MRSILIKLAYIFAYLIGDRQAKNKVKSKIVAAFLLGVGCSLTAKPLLASEITGSKTTNTQIQTNVAEPAQIDILGGKTVDINLFHQFDRFDLSESNAARFLTDADIQNIIGHINSGQLSTINGMLEVVDSQTFDSAEANLYLINPAGILFGPNIQLNILGNFTATTATGIEFNEADLDLSTGATSTDYSQFLGNPTGFIFNGSGPIANLGTLQVASERMLSLMGSTVLNLGSINAPAGGIRLSAIEDNTIVRINQNNQLLALDISVGSLDSTAPKTAAELLTGHNPDIAQHLKIDEDGIRLVRASDVDITIPNDANSIISTGELSVAKETVDGRTIDLLSTQIGSINFESQSGNIKIQSVQSWGSSQNSGGHISLSAAGGNISIGSVGDRSSRTDSGQVTTVHDNENNLFSAGNSTTSGTSGAVISAETRLNNSAGAIDILDNYDEGKELTISGLFEVPIFEEETEGELVGRRQATATEITEVMTPTVRSSRTTISDRMLESSSSLEELENQLYIPVEQHAESAIASYLVNQLESKTTHQFQDYLSLSKSAGTVTLDDVQNTLRQVAQISQQKPGLIYIYYTPNALHKESTRPLVSQKNRPDDELEILFITAEGIPIRKKQWGITRSQVEQVASEFRRQATSQFSRPRDYLPPAQQLYQWMIAPIQGAIELQQIDNLAFIMGDGLRTIPIAALHSGQSFLIEDYSLGLMPTFSLTEINLTDRPSQKTLQVLAMGASRFKEQAPLPAVKSELDLISKDLWLGDAFINENFTLNNLKSRIIGHQYDILHLATHAVFTSGDMEQSYIQLWDEQLKLSDVNTLGLSQSDIELIILSACSTALGDRNSEYGFAGLAVNAGSQSALASLWPVSDEGTLGFMTQFYEYLPKANIRAEALRAAQLNMLQGKVGIDRGKIYGPSEADITSISALAESGSWDFSHPFYWSAFTIVGSPW